MTRRRKEKANPKKSPRQGGTQQRQPPDQSTNTPLRRRLTAVALLVLVVLVVFCPILSFDFVGLDVGDQVINNPHVHGISWENLKYIWTSKCVTSYYPIRTLTFAWDYEIWGLNPFGFKLTNLLIHLTNVLLLFWLARRLCKQEAALRNLPDDPRGVWPAAIGAGLFAVHPVVVEPVAWIGGREELLMTLGALACLHFHLNAADAQDGNLRRPWMKHVGALIACAVACLSNAVGAVIPALIAVWDFMILSGKKRWKMIAGTIPLWGVAAATVAIKTTDPTVGSSHGLPSFFSPQWAMLIFQTYFDHLAALFWPTTLAIVYDWQVPASFAEPKVPLGLLATVLSLGLLWKARRRPLIVICLLWFAFALAPYAQVMPHHILRADRYLYLPLAMLACAAALMMQSVLRNQAIVKYVVGGGLLLMLALGLATTRQVQTWRSRTTLWSNAVRVAPNNAVALGGLADSLAREGRFAEAVPYYEEAIQRDPNAVDTLNNYAIHLATCEDERLRDYAKAVHLARRGCELSNWQDAQLRRTLAKACANYAKVFYFSDDYERAIEYCRQAVEADPEYDGAHFNLALLLATCPDPGLRRPDEAVQLAERAMALADQLGPQQWVILARVQRAAGHLGAADAAFKRAIELAESLGQAELAEQLRGEQAELERARNSDDKSRDR